MSQATEPERNKLLEGLLTREQLKLETGWGERTILRREAEGLPVIVVGSSKFYPIDKLRAWILSHLREREPRRRGRPRKNTSGATARSPEAIAAAPPAA